MKNRLNEEFFKSMWWWHPEAVAYGEKSYKSNQIYQNICLICKDLSDFYPRGVLQPTLGTYHHIEFLKMKNRLNEEWRMKNEEWRMKNLLNEESFEWSLKNEKWRIVWLKIENF